MPYSLRETNIEALYNPIVGTSIMLEFLVKNLLGNMPLVTTNKLFKSSSGLIFECCGIVKDVPIEINKIEVHLDFHIYDILDFNLLIGYPSKKLFQEKSYHGSLDEKLGITASATSIPHLEIPMAEHHPNNDPFEEVKFVSPFVSSKFAYENECPLPTSLKPKPCPSGQNLCAMDNIGAPTLELKKNDCTNKHEGSSLETLRISCSLLESPELITRSATRFYEDHNHLLVLIYKLFGRIVVDAYVYHKYCKSRGCVVVLTL
jgi:hypothetical protein